MTDDSLNKMVEQFQHSRLKAKHIIDRYKIPIEPDEFFSEYVIFLMKNGKIISDIDVHTADITEINEKMSFLYSNINVVECADANGRLHKTVLSL